MSASALINGNNSAPPCLHHPTTRVILKKISFFPNKVALPLTKTKISNHPGPGLLPPAVFSLGEADISILLATNPSLLAQSYAFPPKWGFSVIIPIHKDGIRRDPRNYRRIKLTPLDFGIPERLVDDLFVYFLKYEHNNTERQGFP